MDAASNMSALSALVYADLFDYPLTANEIYRWQISESSFLSSRGLRLPAESVAISPRLSRHSGIPPVGGDFVSRLNRDPRNDTNSLGHSQTDLTQALDFLVKSKAIQTQNSYYFLPNRSNLVATRLLRQTLAQDKLVLARGYAEIYTQIPTIKAIFLTGSLAVGNAKPSSG